MTRMLEPSSNGAIHIPFLRVILLPSNIELVNDDHTVGVISASSGERRGYQRSEIVGLSTTRSGSKVSVQHIELT
jgi:hypothetical protein